MFDSLGNLVKDVFAPNATIELRGCYTATGPDSICRQFKKTLPNARVYGYTGNVKIETWFGMNWAKGESEFVEVRLPGKESK